MTIAVAAQPSRAPLWRTRTVAVVAIVAATAVGVFMARDDVARWAPPIAGVVLGAMVAAIVTRRGWTVRLAAADARAEPVRAESDRLRVALATFTGVLPEELRALDGAVAATHEAAARRVTARAQRGELARAQLAL